MIRVILAILAFTLAAQGADETPRQFAERFYRGYFRWKIRGVPSVEERNRISPFFSREILRLLAVAERQRTEFERQFPLDPKHPEFARKPPWSKEGDLFSGIGAESISRFAIGRVTRVRGRVAVRAHLEWICPSGTAYPWTDILVLDRAGDQWVVADIVFSGGGALVADLNEGIEEVESELREIRK